MNAGNGAGDRISRIRDALEREFTPCVVEIKDQSHLHAGHAGARTGMGHFQVRIVSPGFTGLSLVERHRAIYRAVGDLMRTDIHALGIDALAPEENTGQATASTSK